MKALELITNLSGIFKNLLNVFLKERRKRTRLKINRLKEKLIKLESLPPTLSRAKKYNKLDRQIRQLEDYLIEDD